VSEETTLTAAWGSAVAAEAAVTTKVAEITKIVAHMGDGSAGTIKDITELKQAQDLRVDATVAGSLAALLATATEAKTAKTGAVSAARATMKTAEEAWKAATGDAVTAKGAAAAKLGEVNILREAVKEKKALLATALEARDVQAAKVATQQSEHDVIKGALDKALATCKGAKYDQYRLAAETAKAARATTLTAIERLIDARVVRAHGATGGRCEKPQSNGDRIRRGKCTAETDCCGAATGRPQGAAGPLVTIEVCQGREEKLWPFVAPRQALAQTDPVAENWPFACIAGAHKLAGAAAAALASAYMMA